MPSHPRGADEVSPQLLQVRCLDARVVHDSDSVLCYFSFRGQRVDRLENGQSMLPRPHSAIPCPLPRPAANRSVGAFNCDSPTLASPPSASLTRGRAVWNRREAGHKLVPSISSEASGHEAH